MSGRKCIYTGKDADCKDKVIPHDGGDIDHNWANSVPCSKTYKSKKGNRMPNEIELKLNKAFKNLELAKMDVAFYQAEVDKLRAELNDTSGVEKSVKSPESTKSVTKSVTSETKKSSKRKEKEIKIAHKEKEIQEVDLNKVVEKKKASKVLW